MKLLYLECAMGASGDMLMGALVGLLENPEEFVREMNALGLPGVRVRMEPSVKCGITGTHMSVTVRGEEEESLDHHGHAHDHGHDHDHPHDHGHDHPHVHDHPHGHSHTGIREIEHILGGLPVSDAVKRDALAVYARIAQAESEAHGKPVEQIHFHEVGALDAVADIVGVALLMERLAPDKVVASPINTGYGHVRCAHGVLPVPAPATASILRGVPIYAGGVEGELCTPTGAALLRHFVREFKPMQLMTTEKISCGMGKKDFPVANCVRAFWGDTQAELPRIAEIQCNLDDMSPEAIGYAVNLLLENGALDAFTTPIFMKKNRPGVLLTCLCNEPNAEAFARLMLKHTTTLGVRKTIQERYTMLPHAETLETRFGSVRMKYSQGYGAQKRKPEYDDVARIAAAYDLSITDVLAEILKADAQSYQSKS
ncbi:MAG: nickel pincer cofactor biosynthesis protein LarC [Christensenellaceae bacterium]|nr:nickel pincer cofactor biosynthesis protein LarC [Christensenellaceae bacterium]